MCLSLSLFLISSSLFLFLLPSTTFVITRLLSTQRDAPKGFCHPRYSPVLAHPSPASFPPWDWSAAVRHWLRRFWIGFYSSLLATNHSSTSNRKCRFETRSAAFSTAPPSVPPLLSKPTAMASRSNTTVVTKSPTLNSVVPSILNTRGVWRPGLFSRPWRNVPVPLISRYPRVPPCRITSGLARVRHNRPRGLMMMMKKWPQTK